MTGSGRKCRGVAGSGRARPAVAEKWLGVAKEALGVPEHGRSGRKWLGKPARKFFEDLQEDTTKSCELREVTSPSFVDTSSKTFLRKSKEYLEILFCVMRPLIRPHVLSECACARVGGAPACQVQSCSLG